MNARVTLDLAREIEPALERFAREAGFTRRDPVFVSFGAGIVGHHQASRAADIYEVGGVGLGHWYELLEQAGKECSICADPSTRIRQWHQQRRQNLGWRLYKVLQRFGHWAQPPGYPIQLFGPWTRSEGPCHTISDRLQTAHRDHIHMAK
jgi:hypothetical protein